jgi:hypothetical protein
VARAYISVSVAKNMYPLKRKGKLSLDLFPFFISLFADTDVNAEKKFKNSFQGICLPDVSVQYF